MSEQVRTDAEKLEELLDLIHDRARNVYLSGRLLCSEAVLSVLNEGLRGEVPADAAIRLASALPIGFGGSGCTCGALSGGMLGVGLFLGRDRPCALDRRKALPAAQLLHNDFKKRFGSTCCRVLSKKVAGDSRAHFRQCADITGEAAAMAARIVLVRRPELEDLANRDYLRRADSRWNASIRKIGEYLRL
jgi:C_GCAxxG_C_C family probable redox protein